MFYNFCQTGQLTYFSEFQPKLTCSRKKAVAVTHLAWVTDKRDHKFDEQAKSQDDHRLLDAKGKTSLGQTLRKRPRKKKISHLGQIEASIFPIRFFLASKRLASRKKRVVHCKIFSSTSAHRSIEGVGKLLNINIKQKNASEYSRCIR